MSSCRMRPAKPPLKARPIRAVPSRRQKSSPPLNSSSGELKGKQYAVVVSAGKKKVSANVAGEKFAGGGVAMKVDVGPGLNITGQVAAQNGPTSKGGKKMVWIPKQLGSNVAGHWVEEDSAEAVAAKNAGILTTQDVNRMQEHMAPGAHN